MFTILVEPIDPKDFWYTAWKRPIENKIKKEILDEVKRIQIENNTQYISGYVDGIIRSYYPTAILKYSLELDDNEFKIEMPNFFDSYSTLSWFQKEEGIENKELENYLNDIQFPYLGWASFHTVSRGHLYICDNLYPLSYEQKAFKANYEALPNELEYYKKLNISPTHLWDASEKFLFLIEQG